MRTTAAIRIFALLIFATLTLVGCKSDSGASAEKLDIQFTNPNGITEMETPDIVLNVSGKVVSESEIESVEWVNDRGGKGKANGRENWVTGNIVLQLGVNNITITAKSVDGDTATKTLVVTRENTFSPNASAGSRDPVAMYSYSADLSNAAPVKGAHISRRLVYFFLEPGTDWTNRGIASVKYLCCRGMSGPGEGDAHDPAVGVAASPWVYPVNVSTLPQGGVRRLSAFAIFQDGSESDRPVFDFTVGDNGGTTNRPPTISGSPSPVATVGTQYNFRPVGADGDGDSLRYSITNRPSWAQFDAATGRLHGTPGGGDIGTHANIVISISDGKATTAMPAFSITVESSGTNSASLSWLPPTQRVDNTPLTNLARYNLYYGQTPGDYANRKEISNAGITSYVVDNLSSGNWYFVLTAEDASGLESNPSNEVRRSFQ